MGTEQSISGNRQLVVARVGDTLCGIDIEVVHEIIPVPEMTTVPKSPRNMLGVINVRGVVVPVTDLRACMGFDSSAFTNDTRIVLVTYHDEKIGLVVDAVTEVTTLAGDAFQSLARTHGDSDFVRAVARFQDKLVLEIDHTRVVEDGLDAEPASGGLSDDLRRAIADAAPAQAVAPAVAPAAAEPEEDDNDGPLDLDLLETSFKLLAPRGEELVERFYENLFETAPAVRAMFPDDMTNQRRALLAALATAVGHLRAPEKLGAYVGGLGERHIGYGAVPAHYDVVRKVMLQTMAELAGDLWNDTLHTAWNRALKAISGIMISAAEERQLKAA
jgi:chemotaxis signal transduction protein/hemoglobin-like flavoprotein